MQAKFQLNRFSPRPVHSSGELQERKNKDEQTDMYEHLDPLFEQGVQKIIYRFRGHILETLKVNFNFNSKKVEGHFLPL